MSHTERVSLPEWTECQSMFADGTATALSEFIRAYEPVQSTNPDDKAADEWRQVLTAVLSDAATRMRSHCIETVKEYWQRIQGEDDEGMRELLFGALVVELENLTLNGQEKR